MKFLTQNRVYTLVDQGDGAFLISGHPKYCPTPTPCTLHGPIVEGESVWFTPRGQEKTVVTTPVKEIME